MPDWACIGIVLLASGLFGIAYLVLDRYIPKEWFGDNETD